MMTSSANNSFWAKIFSCKQPPSKSHPTNTIQRTQRDVASIFLDFLYVGGIALNLVIFFIHFLSFTTVIDLFWGYESVKPMHTQLHILLICHMACWPIVQLINWL